jgi:hypothetical protein
VSTRVGLLTPLGHRDFRRLAYGSLVSLLGDGFFRVAIAALVFSAGGQLIDLSKVAAVWAGAQIVTLPAGGWASDRFERRRVMILADMVRAIAIGMIGVLGVTGSLEVWHIMVFGALVGAGNGFFNPATISLVPDLLPKQDLDRANAFLGFARPAMLWIVGPLLGGVIVQAGGPGAAMLLDAGTFVISALFLTRIAPRPLARTTGGGFRQTLRDVGEGIRFVRGRRWAWAPLLAGAVGTLAYNGSFDVLVPAVFTQELGLTERELAGAMGLILAAGGAGSLTVSALIGQRGLPRRFMTTIFVAEAVGVLGAIGYGVMTTRWNALLIGFVVYASFSLYDIAWTTTLQRFVPREMLGRVASLDWLTSMGLAPVGFAMAGIAGSVFGPRAVLVFCGAAGSLSIVALATLRGAREPEQAEAPPVAELAVATPAHDTVPSNYATGRRGGLLPRPVPQGAANPEVAGAVAGQVAGSSEGLATQHAPEGGDDRES